MEIDEKIDKCILEEERGVANFKYNDVIKEIMEFCDYYNSYYANRKGLLTNDINQHSKDDMIKLKVPKEITKKIDFISELNLYVFSKNIY